MIGMTGLQTMKAQRGPRHLVYGTVRRGEYRAQYAVTTDDAKRAAASYEAAGLHQVRALGPAAVEGDHADVLRGLSARWQATRDAEIDLRQQVYAAVVAAVQDGMSESEAARLAGIDRMTVRKVLGKR